jgi:hypothetical protein
LTDSLQAVILSYQELPNAATHPRHVYRCGELHFAHYFDIQLARSSDFVAVYLKSRYVQGTFVDAVVDVFPAIHVAQEASDFVGPEFSSHHELSSQHHFLEYSSVVYSYGYNPNSTIN